MGTFLFLENIAGAVMDGDGAVRVKVLDADGVRTGNCGLQKCRTIDCTLDHLTDDERKILMSGCLINYYRG